MTEKKTSDAQLRATRKWEAKNRHQNTINNYRRSAKLFIRNHATSDELDELEKLIAERRTELQN